jgi:hypothetical protein
MHTQGPGIGPDIKMVNLYIQDFHARIGK